MGKGMWLSWGKSSKCSFVVGKTEGKISIDDLNVDVQVGTKKNGSWRNMVGE